MRELFWIGPPEHGRSEDRVRLWLEPDDLLTQRVGGKKVKRSAGTNEPYLIVGFDTEFKTPNQAFTSEEIHAGFATSLIVRLQMV